MLRGLNVSMVRILIKFTKTEGVRFISHLDTMRTIARAIRRADIPIEYSKGFNPHPSISVALPLSLGVESIAEYADVNLTEEVDLNELKERLNENLPRGLQIVDVVEVVGKKPSAMGSVNAALYDIKLNRNDTSFEEANTLVRNIMSQGEILREKRTKSGTRESDLRPFILKLELDTFADDFIIFKALLMSGSSGNLNSDAMADVIKDFSDGKLTGYPSIRRDEIYSMENNNLINLSSFFSRK